VATTTLGDAIDLASLPPAVRRKAESVLPMARTNLKKAAQAGGKIALGTDAPLLLCAWLANSAARQPRCHGPCTRFTVRDPLKAVRLEAL